MITLLLNAVCAALILLIVRELKPEYAVLGGVFVTVTLIGASVGIFGDLLSRSGQFASYGVDEYIAVMLKVAGVCICVDVCSELCGQCGYPSVAKGILLYGKAQLLVLVFPYIDRLLAGVSSLF